MKSTPGKKERKAPTAITSVSLAPIALEEANNPHCTKACTILAYAHESCSAILGAYTLVKQQRAATRGMTTDQEQDLLRAMLVMAAAGLDGMLKQLIRDTIKRLVPLDPGVKEGFETFVARQIGTDAESFKKRSGAEFLARVLTAPTPADELIELYIEKLTGPSLQSANELFNAANALGVAPHTVGIDKKNIQPIIDLRNKIIHEFDMNLSGQQRKRNLRKQKDMVANVDELFKIGQGLLQAVSGKLSERRAGT